MEKGKKKQPRNVPVHSWEAHPSVQAGESNKTFSIVIISIALVVVLILFLFISSKFVGKAIETPGGARVDLQRSGNEITVTGTLPAGQRTGSVYIEMTSTGIDLCAAVAYNALWPDFEDLSCREGVLRLGSAILNEDGFKSGPFPILLLRSEEIATRSFELTVERIDVYDSLTGEDLFPGGGNFEFSAPESLPRCVAGLPSSLEFCTGSEQCAAAGGIWAALGTAGETTERIESCVQCLNNAQCPAGQLCQNNQCVASAAARCSTTTLSSCRTREACLTAEGQWDGTACGMCGNGFLEENEQCDDRNANPNDGCSASCRIESGFTCEGIPSTCEEASAVAELQVRSTAFTTNDAIPERYTCDGEDTNPPLTVSDIPASTRSLVLILEDLDVDLDPMATVELPLVHWAAWNIPVPAGQTSVTIAAGTLFASPVILGENEVDGLAAYAGPCPPAGETHRYRFKVFALTASSVATKDITTRNDPVVRTSRIRDLEELIVADGSLTGLYYPPPAVQEIPGGAAGGGGYRCFPDWSCQAIWSSCNATLEQSRTCTDLNRCDRLKPTKLENRSCAACEESWVCTPWSGCQNGAQARSCVDEHACRTTLQKPGVQKSCEQISEPGVPPARVQPQSPQVQQPQPWPLPAVSFWDKYKVWIISVPAAVIVITLLALGAMHFLHRKLVEYNLEELKEWIKKEQQSGTSNEDIKDILGQHTGWSKEEMEGKFGILKS